MATGGVLSSPAPRPARRPSLPPSSPAWDLPLPRGGRLRLSRHPLVMGVINLTPDSFSDGGRWLDPQAAVARGLEMVAAGADLLDLGAESTRPAGRAYGKGAVRVSAEEEQERLLPVLVALRAATEVPLSVDTRKGAVARAALAAGADLVNDVTALSEPELAAAVAEAGCPVVLMHLRGELPDLLPHAHYVDVVGEVRAELAQRLERAESLGIDPALTLLDPGLGFAKRGRHNLALLRRLDALAELGRPLLVGASRKSFIGELTGDPPSQRLEGGLAAVAWAAHHGASVVRVHDVEGTRKFLTVWQAIDEAGRRRS